MNSRHILECNNGPFKDLSIILLKFDMCMIIIKIVDHNRDSNGDVNNSRTYATVKQSFTQLNTQFFMGKPFKGKNPLKGVRTIKNDVIDSKLLTI